MFLCESCGWAHLCGEGCTERLIDEPSELLVCPVSGRCYERMLVAEHEVRAPGQAKIILILELDSE